MRVRDRVRPIRQRKERGNDEDGTLFPPAQLARHALANADRRVAYGRSENSRPPQLLLYSMLLSEEDENEGWAGAFRTGQMGHEMKPLHCIRMERALAGARLEPSLCQRGITSGRRERARLFSPCPKLLLTTHPRALQPTKDRLLAKASCKNAISPCQRSRRAVAEEPNRALNQNHVKYIRRYL